MLEIGSLPWESYIEGQTVGRVHQIFRLFSQSSPSRSWAEPSNLIAGSVASSLTWPRARAREYTSSIPRLFLVYSLSISIVPRQLTCTLHL